MDYITIPYAIESGSESDHGDLVTLALEHGDLEILASETKEIPFPWMKEIPSPWTCVKTNIPSIITSLQYS